MLTKAGKEAAIPFIVYSSFPVVVTVADYP
jgi:hypothetical protein